MNQHKHFVEQCDYGYIHAQCRCPNPNKIFTRVPCDNPEHEDENYS